MANQNNQQYGGLERRENPQILTKRDIEPIFSRLETLEHQVKNCSHNVNARIEESKAGYNKIKRSIDELEVEVRRAVKNGDDRLKGHDESITKLESAVANISLQLDMMSLASSDQRSTLASIHSHVTSTASNQSAMLDTLNIITKRLDTESSTPTPKSNTIWQKIPVTWVGVAVVAILGVIIWLLTGDDTIINIFKVAK